MCVWTREKSTANAGISRDGEKIKSRTPSSVSPSSLYQRNSSLWMLVGIAQALFFLFGIPHLCRNYVWDQVFGRLRDSHPVHGANMAEYFLDAVVPLLILITCILVTIPVYAINHPFFEQYKIQKDVCWPWLDPNPKVREDFWKLSKKSLRLVAVNFLLLVPILVIMKMYLENEILQMDKSSFFQTSDEYWPSPSKNIRDVLTMTFIHEFGFYMTHKLMHSYPALYKYHKVHHEYKINTVLAAQHNHMVDYIISAAGPAILAVTLVPNRHSISQVQYALWVLVANVDDHVGYAFPWSPCRWFPGSALTDEHEFHHSKNKGCFASKLSIFNHLFGGYESYNKYYSTVKTRVGGQKEQ